MIFSGRFFIAEFLERVDGDLTATAEKFACNSIDLHNRKEDHPSTFDGAASGDGPGPPGRDGVDGLDGVDGMHGERRRGHREKTVCPA